MESLPRMKAVLHHCRQPLLIRVAKRSGGIIEHEILQLVLRDQTHHPAEDGLKTFWLYQCSSNDLQFLACNPEGIGFATVFHHNGIDYDRLSRPEAVNPANALFHVHGIPWDIYVDQSAGHL
jgi:hypothetical protein